MASADSSAALPQREPQQSGEKQTVLPNMAEVKIEPEATEDPIGALQAQEHTADTARAQVEPTSPGTPASPGSGTNVSPSYHFNRRHEVQAQHYITKSHALVKGNSAAPLDADRDLSKFGEMVSELTHLLAAAGVGRNTTARALAYMTGPDKLDPQQALAEAKKDRKKKNGPRVPSGGSQKSKLKPDAATKDGLHDTGSNDTSQDKTSAGENIKEDDATTETNGNVKAAKDYDPGETTADVEHVKSWEEPTHTETSQNKGTGTGRKRPFRGRKWFNRKGRGNDDKPKENRVQGAEASNDDDQATTKALNDPSLDPAVSKNSTLVPSTNGVAAVAA